jgi:hypothetical protein
MTGGSFASHRTAGPAVPTKEEKSGELRFFVSSLFIKTKTAAGIVPPSCEFGKFYFNPTR